MRPYLKYIFLLLLLCCKALAAIGQHDSTKVNQIILDFQREYMRNLPDSMPADELNRILLEASERGDSNAVLMCLMKKADVNTKTNEGVTPLMFAAQNGYLNIVKILVFNGANVNAVPDDGRTALIAAATFNHEDIMDYLIQNGALLNNRTTDSTTALFYAAAYGYFIPVDMLLFYGADAKLAANDGTTPLMIAALQGNKEIVQLLLKKDSAIDASDKMGWTAIICAAYKNDTGIVRLLVEKGANVNLKTKDGYTALAIAAMNGNNDMVDYLLLHETDATIKTEDNATPYRLSMYYMHPAVRKTLKKYHVKRELLPVFNNIEIAPVSLSMNARDFMYGVSTGISDIKYHLGFGWGYATRLWADRVLVPNGENSYYQFWERRSMFYLNVEKLFRFGIPDEDFQHGVFLECKGLYTYGKYRASTTKPASKFLYAPGIGYQMIWYGLGAKAAVEYLDLGVKDMPPIRFNLTFYVHFERKIYWLSQKYVGELLGE